MTQITCPNKTNFRVGFEDFENKYQLKIYLNKVWALVLHFIIAIKFTLGVTCTSDIPYLFTGTWKIISISVKKIAVIPSPRFF